MGEEQDADPSVASNALTLLEEIARDLPANILLRCVAIHRNPYQLFITIHRDPRVAVMISYVSIFSSSPQQDRERVSQALREEVQSSDLGAEPEDDVAEPVQEEQPAPVRDAM